MEIILLDKVPGLGKLGEKVKVKPGYGRNFLIPKKKAIIANKENLAKFKARLAKLEKAQKQALIIAKKRAETLKDLTVTIPCQASEEGKLYGSIGRKEIARAVSMAGQAMVDKHEVILTTPIRRTGDYHITLQLHHDIQVIVNVTIAVNTT